MPNFEDITKIWDQLTPQEQTAINRAAKLAESHVPPPKPKPVDPLEIVGEQEGGDYAEKAPGDYHGRFVDDHLRPGGDQP